LNRQLSQQEIDDVFKDLQQQMREAAVGPKATPFDFRRLDRIPKSQLKAIRVLHDNFARTLASSLSAYLRAYVTLSLVSVEQLAYAEFLDGLSTPTCLVCLALHPYEGSAVLEVSPNLVFSMLEILLGGKGKSATKIAREITDIEERLLDGFLRIALHDLVEAWSSVAPIEFTVQSLETEPQFAQIVDPGEAFVAVAMEMRIAETMGMMNLAIPSLTIKMMRSRFEHQGTLRRGGASEPDQARMLRLAGPAQLRLDARLQGSTLLLEDLIELQEGDVLPFDYPVDRPVDCLVNGKLKYHGRVVQAGTRLGFLIEEYVPAAG